MLNLFQSGGLIMYPLAILSLVVWAVIFERLWRYRKLGHELRGFHLEAINLILHGDLDRLRNLANSRSDLPSAQLMTTAIDRISAKGPESEQLRKGWVMAVERRRQMINQDLRKNLWLLGTIGSSAPFIGLFGTVVGVLRSFGDIAKTGAGGFAIVAGGISEALIATAAGIVVAVVAVMAYNAFLVRWSSLVLTLRLQTEEWVELLERRWP